MPYYGKVRLLLSIGLRIVGHEDESGRGVQAGFRWSMIAHRIVGNNRIVGPARWLVLACYV